MKFIEYPDNEMMAIDLAQKLAEELNSALYGKSRALFAVPGGVTPGPVFDSLCNADLDWSRIDILLTDERWVPEAHVRSNTRMARARLLKGRAEKARFLPLYLKSENPEDVIAELESNMVSSLPISVLLLGMGKDMHTASLMPGGDRLRDALSPNAPIFVPMRIRKENKIDVRISLSAAVMNNAMAKHLLITGVTKRASLERAALLPEEQAPVRAIMDGITVHWAP